MKVPSLKTSVNHLEDAIITISGPALATSGIIAGVDLVTGGNILKSMSWLALTWAISLLLTLDFQVLALGARAHRVYLSQKSTRRKVFEIVLACCIAASISYVSIQMQSIIARVNAANITIDTAAAQLGINMLALIWERSALVLVLIFLSGWFREDEQPAQVQAAAQAITPDVLNVLIQRLDHLSVTVNQLTSPSMPALPKTAESKEPETPIVTWNEQGKIETVQFPGKEPVTRAANVQEIFQPISGGQFMSKEQEVAAHLQAYPDARVEEIAQACNCSQRTAAKWQARYNTAKEE